jgi:hypothetical protein
LSIDLCWFALALRARHDDVGGVLRRVTSSYARTIDLEAIVRENHP